MAGKRDRDETIQKLLDAVGEILQKDGYVGLRVNKVAAHAGFHKKLIYYYFGGLNEMVKTYIQRKDYWLPLFDSLQSSKDLNRESMEALFTIFLTEQFAFFFQEAEMQKLILWQISEANPLMRAVSDMRELEGDRFLSLTDEWFKGSDVDFHAVVGLLVGCIYYIVLHAKHNGSSVCGIDINEERDFKTVLKTIKQILEWSWKMADETRRVSPAPIIKDMKYELEELEGIVQLYLDAGNLDEVKYKEWQTAADKFPKALMEGALGLEQVKVPMYVRWHQEGLVELSDKLLEKAETSASPDSTALLFLKRIEALLDFLERSFKSETNSFVTVPVKIWKEALTVLKKDSAMLQSALKKLGIAANFTEIILIPVTNWTNAKTNSVPTYQQFRYMCLYLSDLLLFLDSGLNVNSDTLLYKMIELNFNHLRVFNYWVQAIEREVKQYPGSEETVLKRLKRKVQQVLVSPLAVYNEQAASLKEQLSVWIEEEISILNDGVVPAGAPGTNPLKLALPVGAIAYFNKLLYKHKFFAEENQTVIIRHFVENYSSIDTDKISLNSYSSKYRMKIPSDATLRMMRKLFKAILDEINQYLN